MYAIIYGFNVYFFDALQAYVQPGSTLQRELFMKANILHLKADRLLQLMKFIYDFTKFDDRWDEILQVHETCYIITHTIVSHNQFFKNEANRIN